MKVLVVMDGFFPGKNYGGPPVSVRNLGILLDDVEFYIITKNHDLGDERPYSGITQGWNIKGNVNICYLGEKDFHRKSFEKIFQDVKPDLIYLQGLFQECVIPCLLIAKKYKIKVLLAPRGELCKGAFRKKIKKKPYILVLKFFGIIKKINFQSTSMEETEAIIKHLGVKKDMIYFLNNIPSVPNKVNVTVTKSEGEAKFVFLSRIVKKKNILSAIRYFQKIESDVQFDIYGPIESLDYWNECLEEIRKLPPNVLVEYKGSLSHDEVHSVISKYHCLLFPTLSENFGHVIIESLMVGCPVIISDQTPWNDLNEYGAGWAIPVDDVNGFLRVINEIIEMDQEKFTEMSLKALSYINEKFKFEELKSEYVDTLKGIISN